MNYKTRNTLMLSLKIGAGSALAILIAEFLNLQSAPSAGTIALLTLLTTRRQTVQLIINRFITFIGTILICWLFLPLQSSQIFSFAIVLFFVVVMCEMSNMQNTLSVNALIATHFALTHSFDLNMILNEFWLLCIGVVIAYLFNIVQDYRGMENSLSHHLEKTEDSFREILHDIAEYMENSTRYREIWEKMDHLEGRLFHYENDAKTCQENRYRDEGIFYVSYFKMREQQLALLRTMHSSLKKIRTMPEQSRIVIAFIRELEQEVGHRDAPKQRMAELQEIFTYMEMQPLPQSRQEFESRAILYHVLYDLRDYLRLKEKYVERLNPKQRSLYARNEDEPVLSTAS